MSKDRHRSVAQLVEHRSPKPGVVGSSPSAPAICLAIIRCDSVRFQLAYYYKLRFIFLVTSKNRQQTH